MFNNGLYEFYVLNGIWPHKLWREPQNELWGQEQGAFQDVVSEMGAASIYICKINFPVRKLIAKRILKTLHVYL